MGHVLKNYHAAKGLDARHRETCTSLPRSFGVVLRCEVRTTCPQEV
jgi:hypothetical protein